MRLMRKGGSLSVNQVIYPSRNVFFHRSPFDGAVPVKGNNIAERLYRIRFCPRGIFHQTRIFKEIDAARSPLRYKGKCPRVVQGDIFYPGGSHSFADNRYRPGAEDIDPEERP